MRAEPALTNLHQFTRRKLYQAEDGKNGMAKKMHGKTGEALVLKVPVGTVVWYENESGEKLFVDDLEEPAKEIVVAKGGRGGWANTKFTSSTNQAPHIGQRGEPGEEYTVVLEMRLIADVGIIGYPNVGKSTLLAAASSAKPKIASYPFTTLEPNLGVVKLENFRSFVVADIPGLIEGAHMGTGLGFQFLRHVERTSILLHLVDVSEFSPGEPVDDLQKINRELELYGKALIEKPQAVIATKIDVADKKKLDSLRDYCKNTGTDLFAISALTQRGVKGLVKYVSMRLEKMK